jgi:hypothetical protein
LIRALLPSVGELGASGFVGGPFSFEVVMSWPVPMREYPSLRFKTEEEMVAQARAMLTEWSAEQERKEAEEFRALWLKYLGKDEPENG